VFTGLVEAKGRLREVRKIGGAARLRLEAPFAGELARGESVAVSGVCLTVSDSDGETFWADAVERTVSLTTLGRLVRGGEVNLERALRSGDRIGGHMVTGHIDGVATVERVERTVNGRDVTFRLPPELLRHVAPRGALAVDGVSLTVAEVRGRSVKVSLIPETLESTVAGLYRPGMEVNIETDLVAKYREASATGEGSVEGRNGGITLDRLRELGFTE